MPAELAGRFRLECWPRIEREANVFGAELLMPEAAVREAWAAALDAAEVAARFEVSPLAAEWRLYSFGLLAEPPERRT